MVAKKQDRAYGVSQVLEHIEKLQHGHDGLIFTCAQTPYVLGTDEKMYVDTCYCYGGKSLFDRLKWKPASENSIDFKLRLRFPPSPHDPDTPNFTAKPAFLLYTWLGGSANSNSSYEFFDNMDMTDEEWEE
jgi:mRNA guanylyltransferase